MPHVRTQVRNQFKAVLDAALPTADYRIFASRKYKINHDDGRAFVDMAFNNDQMMNPSTMRQTDGSHSRERVASLYVRVQRSATEDDIDDALDEDEVRIVQAVYAAEWGALLEEAPELIQSNFSDDADGGHLIASIILRFDFEYRIDRSDPTTVIS